MPLTHQVRFAFGLFLFGSGVALFTSGIIFAEILQQASQFVTPFASPLELISIGFLLLTFGSSMIAYSFREERT